MPFSFWSHYGVISIEKIRKKTGADRVLVPVDARVTVPGTSLIAFASRYSNSAGETVTTLVEGIMPVWMFATQENQEHAVILPSSIVPIGKQKNSTYRIIELRDKYLWVEPKSTKRKVGRPFQNNEFLLVFEKQKEDTSGRQSTDRPVSQ